MHISNISHECAHTSNIPPVNAVLFITWPRMNVRSDKQGDSSHFKTMKKSQLYDYKMKLGTLSYRHLVVLHLLFPEHSLTVLLDLHTFFVLGAKNRNESIFCL